MRPLFLTLFLAMTGWLTRGQDFAAPAHTTTAQPAPSPLFQLFGGMPIDSSYAVIAAWCRRMDFTTRRDTLYPFLEKSRKTTTGETRFEYPPDSLLTFLYFPTPPKWDSVSINIPPSFYLTLTYMHASFGNARKEFKALRRQLGKWAGDPLSAVMVDAYRMNKKWNGCSFRPDKPANFPILTLTYTVTNRQPDQATVTVLYIRKSAR